MATANEQTLNEALGEVLRTRIPIWAEPDRQGEVLAEKNGALEGRFRADILIHDPLRQPMVIETSYVASDAEKDAKAKIGLETMATGEAIATAIAVHWPQQWASVEHAQEARERLNARKPLRYCVFTPCPDEEGRRIFQRWPGKGWIETSAERLANNLWAVGVSEAAMAALSSKVGEKLRQAAERLKSRCSQQVQEAIAEQMDQQGVLQGLRTAAVMWLNGMVNQEAIARARKGKGEGIVGVAACMNGDGKPNPRKLIQVWERILQVNYDAIFQPAWQALRLATAEDSGATSFALEQVERARTLITDAQVGSTLNVGGELLPILSENRRETAAFYTRPVMAETLAQLTLTKPLPEGGQLADLACGTGTLCRAGYRRLRELAPEKDRQQFHAEMMGRGIRALDISRMAAHLTASSLTLMNPGVDYPECQIGEAPVGGQNGQGRTGSLELIVRNSIGQMLEDGNQSGEITRRGKPRAGREIVVENGQVDTMLLNPPYQRARKGRKAWDLAGLTEDEKAECGKRQARLTKKSPGTGTAGLGSLFAALTVQKTKMGGEFGLVLPSTATAARSWAGVRETMETKCRKLVTVTVAKGARDKEAFSAHTSLNEMLLVGQKARWSERDMSKLITHVTLERAPASILEARELAHAMQKQAVDEKRRREGVVRIGGETFGRWTKEEDEGGESWIGAGAWSARLVEAARELRSGSIVLADQSETVRLPCGITRIGKLFVTGPSHDSIGYLETGSPRGAFEFRAYEKGDFGDTALWEADHEVQTTMECEPTHYAQSPGRKATDARKQERVRNRRGRVFLQRGWQYTSQALGAAWTVEAHHGGSAWMSASHGDQDLEKAAVLWLNSTAGMMLYWANAQRQQRGRGRMQVAQLEAHHIPDLEQLGRERIREAAARFDKLRMKPLKAAKGAATDHVRRQIDHAVAKMIKPQGVNQKAVAETLGEWRKQLCQEPTVCIEDGPED